VSLALSDGVRLTRLSERTGLHEGMTLLKHSGMFVDSDDADRYEFGSGGRSARRSVLVHAAPGPARPGLTAGLLATPHIA